MGNEEPLIEIRVSFVFEDILASLIIWMEELPWEEDMIDILIGIVASDTMKKSKERFSRFYVSLM